ncbi:MULTISPECIES: hypothetical protein [Methylobacterium]|jgi:hypothetical protein|uniref:Uncharacterized protein n=1 Tax=Methylobacterium brachiatum TaxID=269660 RepID=A0ABV1R2J6_9HYPH|nr:MULTISPECIES: hypothetical protein [Methylobacterium]EIZ83523.1 hypothetical protein WYO_3833 [Methylobacterium sp. GXF4]SFJ07828.1 hypothetical protein SAMN02799642_03492 [Methylobacterium brachiatum]
MRCLEGIGRASANPAIMAKALIALLILPLLAAGPAQAQVAGACPPPKKLAAGACVTACPGGYEDRGRDCVYRNQSR